MQNRKPANKEKRRETWLVFCMGKEAGRHKAYIESLNLERDYNVVVRYVDIIIPDLAAGEEVPKDIKAVIKKLTGTSYLGYTVFCDCDDFIKESGGQKRLTHFETIIEYMETHKGIPVFWSNHSFHIWELAHREKDKIISLKGEVDFAKKYHRRKTVKEIRKKIRIR